MTRITMRKNGRLLVRSKSNQNYVAKLEAAIREYKSTHKQAPTLCYMSPATLGTLRLGAWGDVLIMPSKQVRPGDVLVGMRSKP